MSTSNSKSPAQLRRLAEARLRSRQLDDTTPASSADAKRALEELAVHRIELEIQNEELQQARLVSEAALERYTSLFDFAPLGYAILNPGGNLLEVNHAGARLLDRDRSRLPGLPFEDQVAPRDRPAFRMLLGRALERETNQTCDVTILRGAAKPIRAQLTASALTRAERVILLAFEDVTDRRSREERLLETEEALRGADRRKNEFLAALSHELRNPLAAIRNCLLIRSRVPADAQPADEALRIIDRQVALLSRLVDDLLDVTRIARGKIELQRATVDLAQLVRRTIDDHLPTFQASGLTLESRLQGGPFWVDADQARLAQALGNLLGNAEKFTPRGGSVIVSLRRDDDRKVSLRVRDTGVGIDPATLPHVFDSFVQAPQTMDRARGGLGLGLAMVKGLVELHGGAVDVDSEGAGRGTEVTILLPLAAAPAQETPAPRAAAEVRRRRVLVIDDNTDNADSLCEALATSGHEVRVAYDGPTGLEIARQFHPEVVIADIGLPGMDGYAVARAFRADHALASAYLVALSGYAQPDDQKRAASAGFDKHLAKPTHLEQLEQLILEAPAQGGAPREPAPSAPEP